MKIIFDADTLLPIASKVASRSGIFFSAFSLLKEFEKTHEVILYTSDKAFQIVKNHSLLSHYPRIEPRRYWSRKLSYLYRLRLFLDAYRKNLLIRLFCRSITFLILCLDRNFKDQSRWCDKIRDRGEQYVFFSAYHTQGSRLEIPSFTLLHDVIPAVCSDYFQGYHLFEHYVIKYLSPSSYYFANSYYTKADFLKLFPEKLDEEKIKVTHLGASERFLQDFDEEKNQNIREKYRIPKGKQYIFSLCTLEPRKNLLFVIENFLELLEKEGIEDLIFVLGGGYWNEFIGKIEERFKQSKGRVLHVGYVDDEDLANLFSHSLCSVYLSLYEGFGLPVLESMQCGCPVIASNTTSIPEIVGESGILIDPKDKDALQASILKLYRSPSLRENLSQKGLQRAKEFSWEKCARAMLEYMEEVVEKIKTRN